ncbi:Guanylate-binding protein 1 [Lemmus lemmus]
MASEVHMPGPVCLIENIKGQLVANQEALRILSAIKQPVVVVAIVGFYCTGKSYLMNRLAGKNAGFSLGSTVQSHTKGIWMWCVPHPQRADHTLVLLDTEGLGDVEKGDNQNDCWIFALAILLSSIFVYNSMGTINQQAMDQLHYVTELSDRIRTRSSSDQDEVEDSDEFVNFFPDFVWALRDFSLELKANGEIISADEYLENSLRLIQGQRDKEQKFNLPRLCIRKFFPKKKCFVFDRPAHGKKLGQLESLQDQDLNSSFMEQVTEFCSYVFSCSKVKMLPGGIKINGPRLESLVVTYVNTISSGGLPCMENAVLALCKTENAAAVQKAIAYYDQQMSQKLQLPMETFQELLHLHRAIEIEAIKVFRDNFFKDIDQVFQMELVAKLETKGEELYKKNVQASSDHCSALLQDIFGPLEEDVKQGVYSKPGGYCLFNGKIKELKKQYYEEPRKGVQVTKVMCVFWEAADLQSAELHLELERVGAEAARATAKLLEAMQQKKDQLMKEKEKFYQEYVIELTEKMEKEQAQLKEKQQRDIEHKLQEQARLLNEEFQQERKRLQDEIKNLQTREPKWKLTII